MSRSYRNRGSAPRAKRKNNANIKPPKGLALPVLKKNHLDVNLNTRIAAYSPRNRRANNDLENSTLKPLTSSLSPSAKSKGARFVSAKSASIHIIATGRNTNLDGGPLKEGPNLRYRISLNKNNKNMHTSYLTDCAADRTPPRKA